MTEQTDPPPEELAAKLAAAMKTRVIALAGIEDDVLVEELLRRDAVLFIREFVAFIGRASGWRISRETEGAAADHAAAVAITEWRRLRAAQGSTLSGIA